MCLWFSRPLVRPGKPFNLEETQTQVLLIMGSKQFSTASVAILGAICLCAYMVSNSVCCFGYI